MSRCIIYLQVANNFSPRIKWFLNKIIFCNLFFLNWSEWRREKQINKMMKEKREKKKKPLKQNNSCPYRSCNIYIFLMVHVFFYYCILWLKALSPMTLLQLKELNTQGYEVILVTSGAVGLGRQRLRYRRLANSRFLSFRFCNDTNSNFQLIILGFILSLL